MKRFEEWSLNEMAKAYPPGSVVRVKGKGMIKRSSYHKWRPDSMQDVDLVMKVTLSGSKWLEGDILFIGNVDRSSDSNARYAKVSHKENAISDPSSLMSTLQRDMKSIVNLKDKKFFVKGDEKSLLNITGKPKEARQGEYTVTSVDLERSERTGRTVLFLVPDSGEPFSIALADIDQLSPELSKAQKEILGKWVKENCKIDVKYNKGDDVFEIRYFSITIKDSAEGFPGSGGRQCDYILQREIADEMVEVMKKSNISMVDVSKLEVVEEDPEYLDFEAFMEFLEANKVKLKLSDIFHEKRGEISSKKFGL